ncbi:Slime mold cyclic AMP receptor [Musa troglodytarum]|uniref:Slime mold cyclic AMP receptor n=1 Tax=Musa troglodytarum TaxID=320322 RepID=A0A9E7HKN7_9LILI|nr:Slime mold cyclic AMP receptor [Musa troglodytarum]
MKAPSTAVGLSAADRHVLTAVSAGAAALSLAGSAFIVLCYLLFKELHKFSFKLVFFLALSDVFCSFFTIVGDPSNRFFCYAQDYSVHFFCVASFLWTTTIAFTLHRTVVKHKTDVEDYGSVFHLYVWGTSLATTVIRSIGSDYGRPGAWCWTEPAQSSSPNNFLCAIMECYTLQWVYILSSESHAKQCNTAYMQMAVALSEQPNQSDMRAEKKAFNRWGYYPLILIGSWSFATINRLYDFISPDHKIFWLSFLDVGFAGLMGLFNSIAYGLNSSVRRAVAERIELWIPEKYRRWLPVSSKLKSRQPESELTSLIVASQQ